MSKPKPHLLTEKQLKVLTGARTQEVWTCFTDDAPLTAPEIQSKLSFESRTIYYQLKKLVAAGLLVADAGRERATQYRKVANAFQMPDGYQGAQYERLAAKLAAGKLRKSIRQFEEVSKRAPDQPELVDALFISSTTVTLSEPALAELKNRLREVMKEAEAKQTEGGRPVRLVIVTTPDLG